MKKVIIIIGVFLFSFALRGNPHADFPCGSRLVSVGDSRAEVFFKCGEPEWKDRRTLEQIERVAEDRWVRRFVDIEDWIYNFGPNKFVRILTFQENTLRDVQTLGYGYNASDRKPGKQCLNDIKIGARKPEVIVKCGRPSFVDTFEEEHLKKTETGGLFRFNVNIDQWTYDFGPNQFMRVLTFENGKLVGIAEDDYGFRQ
jgi:hypothetical protein